MTFIRLTVFLDMLCKSGKKVYVHFGHESFGEWSLTLACLSCDETSAVDEAAGINGYINCHPGITGFVLRNLVPDVSTL